MSADPLWRVLYISKASRSMSSGELSDLLAGARARNEAHGITGLLIYDAGHFAQVLEGPRGALSTLLGNIRQDPRHVDYALISEGAVEDRYFSGWAMDWANLERLDESDHAALRRYMRGRNIADRHSVYKAMLTFIDEHRQG